MDITHLETKGIYDPFFIRLFGGMDIDIILRNVSSLYIT